MAKSSAYYKQIIDEQKEIYRDLQPELPSFAVRFLNSKHKALQSTKNRYGMQLLTFFKYICSTDPKLKGKMPHEVTLTDISDYDEVLFDDFMDYLMYREAGNRNGANKDSAFSYLKIVRNMYSKLSQLGELPRNPLALYEPYKEATNKSIIRLTSEEVVDIMDAVEKGENIPLTKRGKAFYEKNKSRDTAVITLLLNTGIRVSELVGLDLKDVDFRNSCISIVRKGFHEDTVYFNDDVANSLTDYIEGERKLNKGADTEPLFLSMQGTRFSVDSVERIVKKYSADIAGKKITPHKLRSTFGTHLYHETHDINLVKDALGHQDPSTTTRYYVDDRDENMQRAGSVNLFKRKNN